jgi:site-specific DNA-adenine methylase
VGCGVTVPTRPVLRWLGGKFRLAPWIVSHFPEHRIYLEPFGGSASVLLHKPRAYNEIYNDLDGELVNLFQVLRAIARQSCWRLYVSRHMRAPNTGPRSSRRPSRWSAPGARLFAPT